MFLAIVALLERIARGAGAYPARHEPQANYGTSCTGADFTSPGFGATNTVRRLMLDLLFEEDRTLVVEFQASNPTNSAGLQVPYGQVEVDYVVGGARHSRIFPLTNRLGRVTVTGRQVRATVQLNIPTAGKGGLNALTVDVSAAEGRAGLKEDYPLTIQNRTFLLVPRQLGVTGVFRWVSFLYVSDLPLWFMVFEAVAAAPIAGQLPDYCIAQTNYIPVSWDVGPLTWYAMSTSPLVYTPPIAGGGQFFALLESGLAEIE